MATSKNDRKRTELENHLAACGWVKDSFGHYKQLMRIGPSKQLMRCKLSSIMCRIEVQDNTIGGGKEWRRIESCYYSASIYNADQTPPSLTVGRLIVRPEGVFFATQRNSNSPAWAVTE
jgi:hypothetical protein